MAISQDQIERIAGSGGNVLSSTGDKIGGIGQVYLDDSSGQPSWVTAKTGLFGTSASFVPLQGADFVGDDIQVGYDKAQVKDAPRVDDDGELSEQQEADLYAYYNLGGASDQGDVDKTQTAGSADYVGSTDHVSDRDQVGYDTSGPTTDDAMTRSEEQLRVGTQTQETGRARLRKYVVTENVTQTIPVSREEVRLEREPITGGNVGEATAGPSISEEEHEVVLHAEVPVVQKETVPVERVRLDTETVTEQATVSEDVRKEEIELDGDVTDQGRTRS